MKKYYKIIISIMLLFILSTTNTLQAYAFSETDVYAATEKQFYQYVNEFMKGGYNRLIIHVPKKKFKIDEYQQGICTQYTAEDVLTPLHLETLGFYNDEYHYYVLYYYLDDGQSKAKKLEKKSNQIIKDIVKPDMTDQQKVTAIAEYIIKNCRYVLDEYNEYIQGKDTRKRTQKYSYLFSAYGVLIKGKSVCDGFSRAFNLLARKAGIKSLQVSRYNHVWNVYKIGDDYYEIDTTLKQITGTLITDEPEFNEKDIYKDLIDRYVVLGMDRVKMKPYKTR